MLSPAARNMPPTVGISTFRPTAFRISGPMPTKNAARAPLTARRVSSALPLSPSRLFSKSDPASNVTSRLDARVALATHESLNDQLVPRPGSSFRQSTKWSFLPFSHSSISSLRGALGRGETYR